VRFILQILQPVRNSGHTSLIAGQSAGSISGFGLDSYRLAVEANYWKLGKKKDK